MLGSCWQVEQPHFKSLCGLPGSELRLRMWASILAGSDLSAYDTYTRVTISELHSFFYSQRPWSRKPTLTSACENTVLDLQAQSRPPPLEEAAGQTWGLIQWTLHDSRNSCLVHPNCAYQILRLYLFSAPLFPIQWAPQWGPLCHFSRHARHR